MRYYLEETVICDNKAESGRHGAAIGARVVARCRDIKMAEKICSFLNNDNYKKDRDFLND